MVSSEVPRGSRMEGAPPKLKVPPKENEGMKEKLSSRREYFLKVSAGPDYDNLTTIGKFVVSVETAVVCFCCL